MTEEPTQLAAAVADELDLDRGPVLAVLRLLAEGGTVHFIARYRKEATGGLDEVQIRAIEERSAYLSELHARKKAVLAEIDKQGKLTDELRGRIVACGTKVELEDLYLPFRPKRRTRGMIAMEKGLLPLAEQIWNQPEDGDPRTSAKTHVSAELDIPDVDQALAGARDILAERIAEVAELRAFARQLYFEHGTLEVEKTRAFADQVTKFDNYADFKEAVATIASHRYLAVRRGESEGVLRASLRVDDAPLAQAVERATPLRASSPWADQLRLACQEAVGRQLLPKAQVEVRVELKARSDNAAIDVFATNLKQLLMAAPLGTRTTLGIDPGQRTGCKCAVVDETGRLLAHETIHLVKGEAALRQAEETLVSLLTRFGVRAVAVGNGTHGRETEAFVKRLVKSFPAEHEPKPFCVSVSEAGASVYSASEIAREEFPDLDLTIRGAISIARRLQDPLAELVKIDPKSIGVGQYQHDVLQTLLERKLSEVVASCVHDVGVELNTASASLLGHVSGLGPSLARRIVSHRNDKGAFRARTDLLQVPGLGPRAFEQAAGFLRIRGASNPLDASAVHPERYGLVETMAKDLSVTVKDLVQNAALLERLDPSRYQSADVGAFTLEDIVRELKKPGRDPRDRFEAPQFREDVSSIEDLSVGMILPGVVTNVTAFGAFVDIGVHQDGLVHISQLSDRFIKTPSEAVSVGDRVSVRVLEVDLERRRIGLSAKSDARPQAQASNNPTGPGGGTDSRRPRSATHPEGNRNQAGRRQRPDGGRSGGSGGGRPTGGGSSRQGTEKLTHNPFAALVAQPPSTAGPRTERRNKR